MSASMYALNITRQSFLSLDVTVADTQWARLRGLLGRARLRHDEGIWIVPSQGIHTIGMLFPIDVVYLDANCRVVYLEEQVRPMRITSVRLACRSVLELRPRTIYSSSTKVGDQLLICTPADMEAYWRSIGRTEETLTTKRA